MIMYRQRFSLMHHPIPKDAHGKTFFDKAPGYLRLKRSFLRIQGRQRLLPRLLPCPSLRLDLPPSSCPSHAKFTRAPQLPSRPGPR